MPDPSNSLFQAMQNAVFGLSERVFGYEASWVPSTGGATVNGRVLFNNPTKEMKISGVEFDPTCIRAEYKFGDFIGLKELVDSRSTQEVITIGGQLYNILRIDADFDGKTYIASLSEV